ncbi:hypothetical protein, partial [Shewanella colwelliana]|uniref:hypothetical protein n=1 Tax=Shewanella colwelliana TaxID=23 RepID=UPI001C7D6A1A
DNIVYYFSDAPKTFYEGNAVKLLFILQSVTYNLLILPMFASSVMFLVMKNGFNRLNYRSVSLADMYLLVSILFTFLIYSIKFMGQRSFKVDYIICTLIVLFLIKNLNLKYFSLFFIAFLLVSIARAFQQIFFVIG